jgi:hypothetical protein
MSDRCLGQFKGSDPLDLTDPLNLKGSDPLNRRYRMRLEKWLQMLWPLGILADHKGNGWMDELCKLRKARNSLLFPFLIATVIVFSALYALDRSWANVGSSSSKDVNSKEPVQHNQHPVLD